MRVDLKRRDGRCPFCHAEVAREDDPVLCGDCDARHHEACWHEGGGTCATCGSTRGLGRLPPPRVAAADVPRARPEAALPDAAAFARFGELVAELADHERRFWLRQWWALLVPHLYVPIFWPILWFQYTREKERIAGLVDQAERLHRTYRLPNDDVALNVLFRARSWAEG